MGLFLGRVLFSSNARVLIRITCHGLDRRRSACPVLCLPFAHRDISRARVFGVVERESDMLGREYIENEQCSQIQCP